MSHNYSSGGQPQNPTQQIPPKMFINEPETEFVEVDLDLDGINSALQRHCQALYHDGKYTYDQMRFLARHLYERYEGTPEQKAKAAMEREQREQRRQAATPAAQEWWQDLQGAAVDYGSVVDAVLDLHQPMNTTRTLGCQECRAVGPTDEIEDWPCPTVTAVAGAIGLPAPDDIHLLSPADLEGDE